MRKKREIYSLYFLRVLLSILIVFYHSSVQIISNFDHFFLFNIFRSGLSAVDVFFMLSGYLLEKLYADKKLNIHFFIKRLLKIYPIYLLGTLAYLPIYLKYPHLEPTCKASEVVLKSILLIPQNCSPVLSISWILTHQVYFYFLFMLFYFKYEVFKIIPKLIIVVSSFLLIARLFGLVDPSFPLVFIFSGYLLEFFLGVFIANSKNKLDLGIYINFVLAMALYFSGNFFQIFEKSALRVVIYGLMSFFILNIFLNIKNELISKKYLGLIKNFSNATYSIFLFHFPIISFFSKALILNKNLNALQVNFAYFSFSLISIATGIAIHLKIEKALSFFLNKLFVKNHGTKK